MLESVAFVIQSVLYVIALASCAYTLFAALQVRGLSSDPPSPSGAPAGPLRGERHGRKPGFPSVNLPSFKSGSDWPSVTLLKPLYSAEPGLYENLATFCDQDYVGEIQIV